LGEGLWLVAEAGVASALDPFDAGVGDETRDPEGACRHSLLRVAGDQASDGATDAREPLRGQFFPGTRVEVGHDRRRVGQVRPLEGDRERAEPA
jgi:hypothetical protein